MLKFKNYVKQSNIHGIGLFTKEFIPAYSQVWVYDSRIDNIISPSVYDSFPDYVKDHFKTYAWLDKNGNFNISLDNDRFINHSLNPNIIFNDSMKETEMLASRDILPEEEITANYFEFDFITKKYGII